MQRRRALRLRQFDYSSGNLYFVTACTRGRLCVLGTIENDEIQLSPLGLVAQLHLIEIPGHHPSSTVDAYAVMPNHVHVVLELEESAGAKLGDVVGSYKAAVTRSSRRPGLWQRGYHDHVVRGEDDLARIREYIATNPAFWTLDPENPANTG